MLSKTNLFVLSCMFSACTSFLSLEPCKNISGIDNFDVSRYLGVWYEYSNMFEVFQIGGKCVRANYTLREDDKIGVKNEQVNKWFGNYLSVSGTASFPDPANTNKGELVVSFTNVIPEFGSTSAGSTRAQNGRANYIVADTDYSTYSLVYSCTQIWFTSKESLWVLTRDQKPAQTVVDAAYQKARDLGLPVDSLRQTEQDGCSALP